MRYISKFLIMKVGEVVTISLVLPKGMKWSSSTHICI